MDTIPSPFRRPSWLSSLSLLSLAAGLCVMTAACASSSGPPAAGSGGTSGGTGGTSGATGGTTGGSGGTSGGTGGDNGSGGASAGTGGAGSGGAPASDGGADKVSNADLAPPGLTGTQMDPGIDGDGMISQPGPYTRPPEIVGPLPGAPVGKVTDKMYYASKGAYTDRKFKYCIYVPAQYEKGKRAALMVFHDGRHYWPMGDTYMFNVATTFDTDNPTYRSPEYDRANPTYARFLIDEFLADVVLPNYDIVQDPDGWANGGHSSGASAGFAVAWNRPEKFHKVLTNNGSFHLLEGVFPGAVNNTTPPKPIRIYLNSGTNDMPGWLPDNQSMAAAFAAKKYHYRFQQGTGTHDPPVAGLAAFPDSLKWLWRGYKLPWYP